MFCILNDILCRAYDVINIYLFSIAKKSPLPCKKRNLDIKIWTIFTAIATTGIDLEIIRKESAGYRSIL